MTFVLSLGELGGHPLRRDLLILPAADEPNLEGAAQMIAILTLLEQKTRGQSYARRAQVLEQVSVSPDAVRSGLGRRKRIIGFKVTFPGTGISTACR